MDLFNKLKSMKILLIDDDEWIRDSLCVFFESEGCHLTALETAEEGMEELKKHDYDILATDYRLPGMDGLEFLRYIQDTQPHIMTILITAYKSEDVISEAMKLGVQDFIEKPFTTKTIEDSFTRLLKKCEQQYPNLLSPGEGARDGGNVMELIPWKPFGALSSSRKDLENLWNRFFRETPSMGTFTEEWLPSVDISETRKNFIVKAELPGLDAKDVSVSLSGDLIIIKGEKKREEEEKDEHHHFIERYAGSFQRSFQLPTSVKGDKVEATFDKGVLKVTVPKAEEAVKKEIEIKVK